MLINIRSIFNILRCDIFIARTAETAFRGTQQVKKLKCVNLDTVLPYSVADTTKC